MKRQEMLHVDWNDKESVTYYIDKDKYSKTTRVTSSQVKLSAYEGTYVFNQDTREVKLNDGVNSKTISVKKWKVFFAPVP